MAEPDSTKPSPNAAQETGWTGIEDYFGEIDKSQMKVLNDDIDALLIFAGLFSAVLTAFVVPSYLLLQPDNSQLSVQILDRISAQLARFEILPPFINSTAPDTSPSAFQVPTSARWMNCLWFLSLIFSLSSALFGILAKQWIREYLQWRKVAAAPRENVLLRQLRIEAWEDWRVSPGISTIPALLELAVVLFLVGLVVLVWTLDTVVAIVITTAVSVVIMVLCTVTVLPAVYRRCPYKSPTGWACVIMFDALARVVSWTRWHFRWLTKYFSILWNTQWLKIFMTYLHTLAKKVQPWIRGLATTCSSHIRRVLSDGSASPPSFPRFPNWRERDLYIDDLGSSEISNFNDVWYPYDRPGYTRRVAKDICEVMPLVRALSWVRKGTEDPRLLKHVATSAESLHTDDLDGEDRYYVFMYVLRKLCSAKSKSRELKPLSDLEGHLQSKAYKAAGKGHNMFRGGILSDYDYLDLPVELLDYSDLWVLEFLLLGDTMYGSGGTQARLICLLRYFFFFPDSRYLDMGRTRLQKIYNDAMYSLSPSHQKLRLSGVHTMILEILCSVSEVYMEEGTKRISADGPRVSDIYIDNEMRLAVQMFDQNAGYSDPFARHQFVMMADLVMRSSNYFWFADTDLMGTLLEKMSEAVTISLKEGYENCGCYHELPWISSMLSIPNYVMRSKIPPRPLLSFLDVLEKTSDGTDEDNSLDEGNGSDDDSGSNEDITGREAFIKLKKRVKKYHPRSAEGAPVIAVAADLVTPDSEEEQPSERMLSEITATVLDSKDDTTAATGDGEMQQGGNDNVAVPGLAQASQSPECINAPTGLPEEKTEEGRASSHYQRELTLWSAELDVSTDLQDAIPSPGQDLDFTTERDSGDITQSSTELRMGQSDSLEAAASDNPRLTAPTLPLHPSASNGSPSDTWSLSHDNPAHTDNPLVFSHDVGSPGDSEDLSTLTLPPHNSTPGLRRITTHSPGPSVDEDVQPVEHSWNPAEGSGETGESIEMTMTRQSGGLD